MDIWIGSCCLFAGMRRGNRKDPAEYIRIRMTQLYTESHKCHDPHDAQWYNRCAEELHWVLKLMEKGKKKSDI